MLYAQKLRNLIIVQNFTNCRRPYSLPGLGQDTPDNFLFHTDSGLGSAHAAASSPEATS